MEKNQPQCPGQDMRFWKPGDIFESPCPFCGASIEFWKDDPFRPCKGCGQEVRNPRLDLGCASWCAQGEDCLARLRRNETDALSPEEKALVLLHQEEENAEEALQKVRQKLREVEAYCRKNRKLRPLVLKLAVILWGRHCLLGKKMEDSFLNNLGLNPDTTTSILETLHGDSEVPEKTALEAIWKSGH